MTGTRFHDNIDNITGRLRARLRDIDALEDALAEASPRQLRDLARRAVVLARDGYTSALTAIELSRDVARAADIAREIIVDAGLMDEEPPPRRPTLRVVDDA